MIIEIADDGGGIDPQKVKRSAMDKGLLTAEQAERMRDFELVNLVFLPGFSTAARISNISGRGVGMDVVKTNIEKIGGAVDLASKTGAGTTVKVRIPLTLAIIPGLVITAGGERFVIPQASLVELLRVEGSEGTIRIEWIHGAPVCRQRGRLLPLIFLNDALKLGENGLQQSGSQQGSPPLNDVYNIIVLQAEEKQFGLVVDSINDTQEIVVKPLGKQLKRVQCYAGATIMGDGRVALILDVLGLAHLLPAPTDGRASSASDGAHLNAEFSNQKQALLLFRAGSFERLAVPLSLVARLEEIPKAKIERAAGREVVQYRGKILALVPLAENLGTSPAEDLDPDAPAQVIVFSDADRQIGLVVDRIVDIVEDVVTVKRSSDRPGLLGSAVVGQKITDFLDLQGVIQQAEQSWFQRPTQSKQATVLLAEASAFSRSLLRNSLEIAGHRVIEAATEAEALDKLSKHEIDVVVASLDMPRRSAFSLLESVKKEPHFLRLPVLALAADGERFEGATDPEHDFTDYLNKFDRVSILLSIEKLAAALHSSAEAAGRSLALVPAG